MADLRQYSREFLAEFISSYLVKLLKGLRDIKAVSLEAILTSILNTEYFSGIPIFYFF